MPVTIGECLEMMRAHPRAPVLAGATAAQLGWPGGRAPTPWIDLGRLLRDARGYGPRRVRDRDPRSGDEIELLELPALCTLEALRADALLRASIPALSALIGRIGSSPVRRLATLAGNLCWPGGDLGVAMLTLNAQYAFASGRRVEACSPEHLPERDLLLSVRLPLPSGQPSSARLPLQAGAAGVDADRRELLVLEKVGFRAAFTPSLVTFGIRVADGAVRIAAGGGAATPLQRLSLAEQAVRSRADRRAVGEAVRAGLRTSGDALASREERIDVAARCIAGHLALAGMLSASPSERGAGPA